MSRYQYIDPLYEGRNPDKRTEDFLIILATELRAKGASSLATEIERCFRQGYHKSVDGLSAIRLLVNEVNP